MVAKENCAPCVLEISADALSKNYHALAARIAPARLNAVVKADGYGLGSVAIVQHLAHLGCKRFFVATLAEGIHLRRHFDESGLPDLEFIVFNGIMPSEQASFLSERITPMLCTPGQIKSWQTGGKGRPAMVHIDTGINRLGVGYETVIANSNAFIQELSRINCCAIISHLAAADDPDDAMNSRQLQRFQQIKQLLGDGFQYSLSASGGAFIGSEYHFDFVRAGIALYGGIANRYARGLIHPVVRAHLRILQIKACRPGDRIGYGGGWVVQKPCRIATIACGYRDGLARRLARRAGFVAKGQILPLVGRISMDMATLEIPDDLELGLNDRVELIGPSRSLQQLAADLGTIDYEVLCSFGNRWQRSWVC